MKRWAQEFAAMGGRAKTEKKAAAVRENGKKGGRPKMTPVEKQANIDAKADRSLYSDFALSAPTPEADVWPDDWPTFCDPCVGDRYTLANHCGACGCCPKTAASPI